MFTMNETVPPTEAMLGSISHTAICSFGLAVDAMAVFGNILNILVLPRLSNVTDAYRFLLISLAVTDLFAGLSSFSYLIYSIQTDPRDSTAHDGLWCRLSGYVITLLIFNDVAVIMCVAIYKYVTITQPLRYSLYLTTRRAAMAVAALFVFLAVVLGFCSTGERIFDNSAYQKYYGVCLIDFGNPLLLRWTAAIFTLDVYLPTVVVCALYAHIAVIARKQAKRITAAASSRSCDGSEHRRRRTAATEAIGGRSVSAWKGMRSALLLTVGFMVAWIPFTAVYLMVASEAAEFTPLLMTVVGNLVMCTTWWNYVIYSLCSAEFRYAAVTLLENVWRKLYCCRKGS